MEKKSQFGLVSLDQYGNPKLEDGSHSDRSGVEQAAYLHQRLGFAKSKRYACAEIIITEVEAKSHGSNEAALNQLNNSGLRPQ